MTHRPEHDDWSKLILLGEGSEAERAAWAGELEACDRCAAQFVALGQAAASADRMGESLRDAARSREFDADPELREMTQRFESQAMDHVSRETGGGAAESASATPVFRFLRPALGIAAALVLGATGIFFLTREATPPTPIGGELGGEILVQQPESNVFVWNAAGCESFTVTIIDLSGKTLFVKRDLRETRLVLDESLRAAAMPAMSPGQEYEIQIFGTNPRPGQKDPSSKPLRFTLP